MSIIDKAKVFAKLAHESINQKRKYTDEPYINHPEKVTYLVSLVTNDENMIAAAWLHDVLEDVAPKNPAFGEGSLLIQFGEDITNLVLELTDKSLPSDGNREKRKAIDRKNLSQASDRAKIIKLADIIGNTQSVVKHDPDFAKVFLPEMYLLINALGFAKIEDLGLNLLKDLALDIMYRGFSQLDIPFPSSTQMRIYKYE